MSASGGDTPHPRDPWREGPAQLNARLLRPMLDFYETMFGRARLEELVEELGTTLGVLQDPDRWFSAERFAALNRAMVQRSGDEQLPYRAGRAFMTPGASGAMRIGAFDVITPKQALEAIPRYSRRFSKIGRWEVRALGKGRAEVTYTTPDATLDDITFCGNRHGSVEGTPVLVDAPAAQVDHPICMHEHGGDRCVYVVYYSSPPPWTRLAWLATATTALAGGVLLSMGHPAAWTAFGASAGLFFAAFSRSIRDTRRQARDAREVEVLIESNDRRVAELSATQRVADAVRGSLDEGTLIERVLAELHDHLSYDRALYLRIDEAAGALVEARGVGFAAEDAANLSGIRISLHPEGEDRRLFGNIIADDVARLIADVDEYADRLLPANRDLLRRIGTTGFVAAPVSWRGRKHGLLLVDRRGELALDARDVDVLGSVAGALGAALASAQLFERIREELLINQKFRQYLPEAVVDDIRADPEAALQLGGDRIQAGVMFCDIAAFTTMSSRATPEEVVRALNRWYGMTDPIIREHRGIIDKRIGDAVLVVFLHEDGEPHPVRRAVASAEAMQAALAARGPEIGAVAPGFAAMQVRHSIHYGAVIAGNVGSVDRMEYTIIGDAVNVCAKLEEITPAGEVWLTGEALEAMAPEDRQRYAERASEQLSGRDTLTQAFEVIAEDN